jgi:hypothetical protein
LNRSESVKAINIAILMAQGEFPVIEKSAANPFYKSKYAPYDGIMKIIRPILCKNKLIVEHSVVVAQGELEAVVNVNYKNDKETTATQIVSIPQVTVVTRVTHADSEEWKEIEMTMPAEKGNSHGIQAVITYIKRNNAILLLDIVVGDEDDDGNNSITPDEERSQRSRTAERPRIEARPRSTNSITDAEKAAAAAQNTAPKTPVNQQRDLEKDILDAPFDQLPLPFQDDPKPEDQVPKTAAAASSAMTDKQRSSAGLLLGAEYDEIKAELNKLVAKGMDIKKWKGWLQLVWGVDSIQFIKRNDFQAIMKTIKESPLEIDQGIKL